VDSTQPALRAAESKGGAISLATGEPGQPARHRYAQALAGGEPLRNYECNYFSELTVIPSVRT